MRNGQGANDNGYYGERMRKSLCNRREIFALLSRCYKERSRYNEGNNRTRIAGTSEGRGGRPRTNDEKLKKVFSENRLKMLDIYTQIGHNISIENKTAGETAEVFLCII